LRRTSRKIDQPISIVFETEQIADRRNSPLNSRARISDGSGIRFFVVSGKIFFDGSMRYDASEQSRGSDWMKIRFGEFPEEHHFLQIMRPFVEWTFKFFGWLVIISTVQFAQERTGSQVLLYVKWFSYLLILGFIGAFVDWILSFKKCKTISGAKLIEIATASVKPDAEATAGTRSKKLFWRVWHKLRGIFVALISLSLTVLFVGAANIATDRIISSLVEFQQRAK
jgi:hypothetical protein